MRIIPDLLFGGGFDAPAATPTYSLAGAVR